MLQVQIPQSDSPFFLTSVPVSSNLMKFTQYFNFGKRHLFPPPKNEACGVKVEICHAKPLWKRQNKYPNHEHTELRNTSRMICFAKWTTPVDSYDFLNLTNVVLLEHQHIWGSILGWYTHLPPIEHPEFSRKWRTWYVCICTAFLPQSSWNTQGVLKSIWVTISYNHLFSQWLWTAKQLVLVKPGLYWNPRFQGIWMRDLWQQTFVTCNFNGWSLF